MKKRVRPDLYNTSIKPKRERSKKLGLCIDCSKPADGKTRCLVCQAAAKHRHDKWVTANKPHVKQYANERRKAWPEITRKAYLLAQRKDRAKRKYGLTLEQYDTIVSLACAICDSRKHIGVDHCHKTGKVRGPLCKRCNSALGWYENNSR